MSEPCPSFQKIVKEHMKNCTLCKGNLYAVIRELEKELRELSG